MRQDTMSLHVPLLSERQQQCQGLSDDRDSLSKPMSGYNYWIVRPPEHQMHILHTESLGPFDHQIKGSQQHFNCLILSHTLDS